MCRRVFVEDAPGLDIRHFGCNDRPQAGHLNEWSVMAEKRMLQFRVVGEDPQVAVAPLFSNFLAVSHVGKEVQLEFIFLDIGQIAQHFENVKAQKDHAPSNEADGELAVFQGKTVAKVVVPSWAFLQLKAHLIGIFEKLEIEESGEREKTRVERAYGV